MNFLLEKQVKIGRIISQLIWIILPLVSLSFILQACDENKFPVNPVPDTDYHMCSDFLCKPEK